MKWVTKVLTHDKAHPPAWSIVAGYDFASQPDQSAVINLPMSQDWTPQITAAAIPEMPDLTEEFAKISKALSQLGVNIGETFTAVKALSKALEPAKAPSGLTPGQAMEALMNSGLHIFDINVNKDYGSYNDYGKLDITLTVAGPPDAEQQLLGALYAAHKGPKGIGIG